MRKKILFLSPLPPPHYGSAMSSEACLNILKNSKMFEVKNIKLNYSQEIFDIGKINLNKIKGINAVKNKILDSLSNFKPDLIYFVPATSRLGLIRDYYFIKLIKKDYKKKILFHIRSRIIRNFLNNLIYKKMFYGQKAIIVGNALVKDVSPWIKKQDIFILPNAIKNEISGKEFTALLSKRKKNKILTILFLSNMDKTKGWPKLLEACKILNKKQIKFNCNFVGEWPSNKEKKGFFSYIQKNNLEKNVFCLGKKTGKEKTKELGKADVLIFPTDYHLETFGRVIIEAMMFGLPVIANGIASIPSIIQHNRTGFVLKENSPEEIVKFIQKLEDIKLREKMGKAGRKRFLEKFELKDYEKKFIQIIKSA